MYYKTPGHTFFQLRACSAMKKKNRPFKEGKESSDKNKPSCCGGKKTDNISCGKEAELLGVEVAEEVQMQGVCTMSMHDRGRGQAGCLEKEAATHLSSTPYQQLLFLCPNQRELMTSKKAKLSPGYN